MIAASSERYTSPPVIVGGLAAAAAGLLGLVAGVSPLAAVLAAFALLFAAVVLQDLAIGVCLMAALVYLDAVPAASGLSLAKVAGLLLGISWLAAGLTRRDRQLFADRPFLSYALLLFLGWNAVTLVWAEERGDAIAALTRYAPNLLLIPIVYFALRNTRDVRRVLATLAGAATATALLAVLHPASDPSHIDVSRAAGLVGDANELAAGLVVGGALAAGFALRRRTTPGMRTALLLAAGVCVLGIFLSLSRGGLVALGAALIAAVLLARGRRRRQALAGAMAVVALCLVYFTMFASLPARERVTDVGGGTGRVDLWTVGWRMVEAHPLKGIGAGNFPVASIHYLLRPGATQRDDFIITTPKVAHNTVLEILAETGVPGAALFLGIVAAALWSLLAAARRFERAGDPDMGVLCRALMVGTVGYLVAGLFISANYSKLLWLLLALGPALLAVSRRAESSSTYSSS